jgi:hypothetical protein
MNYQLKNDSIDTIPIGGADAGDVFTAVSGDVAAVEATINGTSLVLRPLVEFASGISITVTDAAGSPPIVLTVDVVPDVLPRDNLSLDLANVAHAQQPVNFARGRGRTGVTGGTGYGMTTGPGQAAGQAAVDARGATGAPQNPAAVPAAGDTGAAKRTAIEEANRAVADAANGTQEQKDAAAAQLKRAQNLPD